MFNLEIECENAAFDNGNHAAEIARILRDLADAIAGNGLPSAEGDTESGYVRDLNGNRVGEWRYRHALEGEESDG